MTKNRFFLIALFLSILAIILIMGLANASKSLNPKSFCKQKDIQGVYQCGNYTKVVSSNVGTGSTFYTNNMTAITCFIVSPQFMTEQCKVLMNLSCSANICK